VNLFDECKKVGNEKGCVDREASSSCLPRTYSAESIRAIESDQESANFNFESGFASFNPYYDSDIESVESTCPQKKKKSKWNQNRNSIPKPNQKSKYKTFKKSKWPSLQWKYIYSEFMCNFCCILNWIYRTNFIKKVYWSLFFRTRHFSFFSY
jgi:hypothetical protein